jgi:DNA-binding PadR family transcriptional regulator
MPRRLSAQSVTTLAALDGGLWLHGYELARRTGLKPGTLYPILERLEGRGLLEGRWEPSPDRRPARHSYRLTEAGSHQLALEEQPGPTRATLREALP